MLCQSCGYLVTKFCLTLCDPMDCSLPGSSVRGISEARILKHLYLKNIYILELPFPTAGNLLDPWIKPESPASPALSGRFLATESPGKPNMSVTPQ